MSDPFRDGMEAALRRSETLEEENELLREEIARIREQATALKESAKETSPETHVLAGQALGVLDQLEALSKRPAQVRVAVESKVAGDMRPLDAVSPSTLPTEHASPEVIAVAKATPKPAPPPPTVVEKRTGVSVGTMIAVAFGMFVVGLYVGTCMH